MQTSLEIVCLSSLGHKHILFKDLEDALALRRVPAALRLSDSERGYAIQPVSSRIHAEGFLTSRRYHRSFQVSACSGGVSDFLPLLFKSPRLCSWCDLLSSLLLWSCAKITRSKGKWDQALTESRKALKKRLNSTCIDPETIRGHAPRRYVTSS